MPLFGESFLQTLFAINLLTEKALIDHFCETLLHVRAVSKERKRRTK
jgi:hypothetical protein